MLDRIRQLAGIDPARPNLDEGKPAKGWVQKQLDYWKAELQRKPKDKSTRREYQSIAAMARKLGMQAESVEEVLEQTTSANVGAFVAPQPKKRKKPSSSKGTMLLRRKVPGLEEKTQPHLNKYDPGSLLGWTVFLLQKHGLEDAAEEVRRVSRTVSRAWQKREE